MTPSYHSTQKRIDFLLKKFHDSTFDDYTQSQIANYACVLISGFVENAIRDIISLYCEKRAAPPISNYVKNRLERFQNPDPESIGYLIDNFDSAANDRLEQFWSGEIKDAIGSIVGNRHLIAHGRNTSLTLVRVSQWFKSANNFVLFLEKEFA